MPRWQQPKDGLDMGGRRRVWLLVLLPRKPNMLVASRVRRDARMVEDHRQRLERLANRAASVSLGRKCRDELHDIGGGDPVHVPAAEQTADPRDFQPVADFRVLGQVEPGRSPAPRRLCDRRRADRPAGDQAEIRNPQRSQLAIDVALPSKRLRLCPERAPVSDGGLASAKPVLDAVALAAILRRPRPDPDASHAFGPPYRRLTTLALPGGLDRRGRCCT